MVAQKALFPCKLFLALAMGRGFVKLLELLSLTHLQADTGEEQKKVFPQFKRIISRKFWAILRGRFPHRLFLLASPGKKS